MGGQYRDWKGSTGRCVCRKELGCVAGSVCVCVHGKVVDILMKNSTEEKLM